MTSEKRTLTMTSSTLWLTLSFGLLTFAPSFALETRMTFRDPDGHPFQQLAVDKVTGSVFVGATNRLHRLSSGLTLIQSAATGPREDNPDCPPPPRPCLGDRSLRDAVTKGLVVDNDDDTLLLCSTLYHGSCQKLSLSNITRVTQLVHQPLVPNMADMSCVLFIGPGPEQGKAVVYIGAEYSELGNKLYRNLVPSVCSRELKDLNLTFEDPKGSTAKTILDAYRESFLVQYIHGFTRGQFAYFLSVQKESLTSTKVVTRIARVCTQDKYFRSFVEVPFLCEENLTRYHVLRSVWLEEEAGGASGRLVAIFVDDPVSFWKDDKSTSVLCSVSMDDVDRVIDNVMKECYSGQDRLGPPHYLKSQSKTCTKTTMSKDLCATSEAAKDIPSMEGQQPVVAKVLWTLPGQMATAVAMQRSGQHSVAYIGTADGELIKVLQLSKRGQEVVRMTVDSSGPVTQILPSMNMDHLYVLTQAKVSLVWTHHCEQKHTCEECVADKDPMCGWCVMQNSCTAQSDCSNSAVSPSWLPASSSTCAKMTNVQPEVVSYESLRSALASKQISFELEQVTVQPSSDLDLGCLFITGKEEHRTKATLKNKVISCPLPSAGQFPKIPEGKDHESMVLHFHVQGKSIVTRSVSVYDCRENKNCSSCTGSSYGCYWCHLSGICVQKHEQCPSGAAINSSSSCPLIWTSSPDNVLVHAGEEMRIAVQVRNLQPGQKMGINCRFAYLGTENIVSGSVSSKSLTCDSVMFDYPEKEQLPYVMADFQVLWGSQSLPLDNPLGIKVRIYKCPLLVTNCGKCLSMDAGYECGWCGDRCTLSKHCPTNWLDRTATCPGPQILRFSPTTGPIKGKTHLSVSGLNLGKSYSDIKVTVAGLNCEVKPDHYEPSSGFVCETEVTPATTQGVIVVKVDNKYTAMSDSGSPFSFVDPVLVSIQPPSGPRSGGTIVSIKGENMDSGSDASISFDGQDCQIVKRNHTIMECRAPKKQGANNEAEVKINFGGLAKTSPQAFTYEEDPTITRVEPKRSIISGGTTITVLGKQLQFIQKPEFFVTYGGQFVTATCFISSSYSMDCQVPSLRPQLDSSGVNITDSNPLEVHYGFTLDGVMTLKNISHKSDFGPLLVYPDPVINLFPGAEQTKQFMDTDNLVINGRFSIVNNLMASVSVHVGNEPCLEVTSTESAITCKPPASAPKGTDRNSGKAAVWVRIGNMVRQVGFLRYYEMSSTSKPMALGVILGVVIPIVAIIILLTVCVLRRHRKHKPATDYIPDVLQDYQGKPEDEEIGLNHVAVADVNGFILDEKDCSPYIIELLSHIEDPILRQNISAMMIPRNKLNIGEMIGKGHFGAVYKAQLQRGEDKTAQVAAKTLQAKSSDADTLRSFLNEVVYLKNLHHPNLLPVVGVCLTESDDPVIITPFMATEDLKSFIAEPSKTLTVVTLLSFSQQIVDAMTYLQEVKVVHRNLAACNCIVSEDGRVQLTDYGMTMSLFPQSHYTVEDSPAKILVKWMATEVMENFDFSHKSDVWAFGIVLWELMTRGLTPYPDIQNSSLLPYLKEGQRMKKPKQCPEPVYMVMTQCWHDSPQERPDFSVIGRQLRSLVVTENGATEETALLLNQSIDISNSTEYLQVIA